MNRGQRITAIQRSARTLSEKEWVDTDLVLQEFGFPLDDPRDYGSQYEYAVSRLRQGDDAALAEMDAYLHPTDVPAFEADDDDGSWRAGSFRLFISHTTAQKRRAGNLAKALDRYGVHSFVAHDAIEPTREWQDEIEKALRSCDALCAILTPDFVDSRWCDQEVGMVVAQRKLVVPVKVGVDPHGFIGKYQALTVTESGTDAWDVADKVLRALIRSPLTAEAVAPAIVRRYAQSTSFASTRTAFDMVQAIPRGAWTPDMIAQADRASQENTQVTYANVDDGTGRSIPELVNDMVQDLRPRAEPAGADDDIPF